MSDGQLSSMISMRLYGWMAVVVIVIVLAIHLILKKCLYNHYYPLLIWFLLYPYVSVLCVLFMLVLIIYL